MKKISNIKLIQNKASTENDLDSINTCWAFNTDTVDSWAFWEKGFSKEECEKIITFGNNKNLSVGKTGSTNNEQVSKVRNCELAWLYPSKDIDWVYRKSTTIIQNLNNQCFNFDLFGFTEGFQFTKYKAPSGKYGKHIDSIYNSTIRKLSFVLQLSDPKDYEGGDLLLYFEETPIKIKKEQGYITVFPSYVLHEVTPVTKGIRYSLVSWVTGPKFK